MTITRQHLEETFTEIDENLAQMRAQTDALKSKLARLKQLCPDRPLSAESYAPHELERARLPDTEG
jgi:hypothetical protein